MHYAQSGDTWLVSRCVGLAPTKNSTLQTGNPLSLIHISRAGSVTSFVTIRIVLVTQDTRTCGKPSIIIVIMPPVLGQ